jgi:hypothetical protein
MYDIRPTLAIEKATDMIVFHAEAKGIAMAGKSDEWADKAKRYLRAEMARAGVRNAELAKRLTEMGLPETEASVQVKINRGAFAAWFLIAALSALGCAVLRLD